MSSSDHSTTDAAASASAIANQLQETDFVRLVATPDGDAVAATGVLARTLAVPFQASVAWKPVGESEADVTVTVGRPDGDIAITDEPLSVQAFTVARKLNSTAPSDPNAGLVALALAGIIASERDLSAHTDALGIDGGLAAIDSQPGVGVPTTDLADGLAHTTLVHAPFSGDVAATTEALSAIDESDEQGSVVASMLALSVVGEANTRASTAIERAIHPSVAASTEDTQHQLPFATLAGYADVLDSLARSWPGTGLALALGHDCRDAALDGWREHARTAHAAVRAADLSQHEALVVVDATETGADDGTIGTIARLVRDYCAQTPDPIVLVIADEAVAGTTTTRETDDRDVTTALANAVTAVDKETRATGRGRYGYAPLDTPVTQHDAFVDAFQEAL